MSAQDIRTVHARHDCGEEVVRYNRAGKWFIELVPPAPSAPLRKRVGIGEAVCRARELLEQGGEVFFGRPGGQSFDARFKRAGGS